MIINQGGIILETNLEEILKKIESIEEYLAYIAGDLKNLDKKVKELESNSPTPIY